MWRWTYHEPSGEGGPDGSDADRGLELQSSIAYADAEEARSAATSAYPGIPVIDADNDQQADDRAPEDDGPMRHRCRSSVPAMVALAVLVALLMWIVVIIVRQRSADDHARPGPRPRLRFRPVRPG